MYYVSIRSCPSFHTSYIGLCALAAPSTNPSSKSATSAGFPYLGSLKQLFSSVRGAAPVEPNCVAGFLAYCANEPALNLSVSLTWRS